MTESNRRDKEIRVNQADKRALKSVRDEIDPSLALGAVARLCAREYLRNNGNDSGGMRL